MPKNTQSTVIGAGKLLQGHAMVRDDIADATKKLSHEVTAPTMNIAKLEHLQQYLIDARMLLLRKRPAYQLANGNCSLDVNVYVDSDWAVCAKSRSRKSTSGSTVNVLGCNLVPTARAQATLALSSSEAISTTPRTHSKETGAV